MTHDPNETTRDLYKAYLEDLGRIGSRHETLRQFYVSVISALFVLLSLSGKDGPLITMLSDVRYLVGGVGVAISLAWFFHMGSFADVFHAKEATLREWEKDWNFGPFTHEFTLLTKRFRLTSIDRVIAWVFVVFFVVLIGLSSSSGSQQQGAAATHATAPSSLP